MSFMLIYANSLFGVQIFLKQNYLKHLYKSKKVGEHELAPHRQNFHYKFDLVPNLLSLTKLNYLCIDKNIRKNRLPICHTMEESINMRAVIAISRTHITILSTAMLFNPYKSVVDVLNPPYHPKPLLF